MKLFNLCFLLLLFLMPYPCLCGDCKEMFSKNLGRSFKEHTLFVVIAPTDTLHQTRNMKFFFWVQKIGFSVRPLFVPDCLDDLEAMYLAAHYRDVINLKTQLPDNFENYLNILSMVGNKTEECNSEEKEVCKSSQNYVKINNEDYETCMPSTELVCERKTTYGKIISKSIEKYNILLELIDRIDENSDTFWKQYVKVFERTVTLNNETRKPLAQENILLCLKYNTNPEYIIFKMNTLDSRIIYVNNCEDINEFSEVGINILAYLTPKPSENKKPIYIPTIFLRKAELLLEHNNEYKHATVLIENNLNHGLQKFIRMMKWQRIAIISDNSPTSEEFIRILVRQFHKMNIVYALKSCVTRICDFHEALKSLKENNAKIIIGNVENKNIKTLLDTASKMNLTSEAGVMWMMRNWPTEKFAVNEAWREVYYLLATRKLPNFNDLTEAKALDSIEDAIQIIRDSIDKVNPEDREMIMNTDFKQRSRLLINMYKNEQKSYLHKTRYINLVKMINMKAPEVVFSHDTVKDIVEIAKEINYKDLTGECSFRSQNFDSPCNDIIVFLLMLVIFIFLLAFLMIILVSRFFSNNNLSYDTVQLITDR